MWPAKHGRPIFRCARHPPARCVATTTPFSSCSRRRWASRPHVENRPVCAIITTSAAHPNRQGSMKRLSTGVVIVALARDVAVVCCVWACVGELRAQAPAHGVTKPRATPEVWHPQLEHFTPAGTIQTEFGSALSDEGYRK